MKFFGAILALLALALFGQPALALSDAEYKALLASSQEFRDADEGLNGAWREAEKNLTAAEFKKLKADQARWIKKGRDEEAKALIAGGSSKEQAYADVTTDRIASINKLISRSVLIRSEKGMQGLYTYASGGASGTLEVWWYDESSDEHYVVFENSVADGRGGANLCSFTGKGNLEGNTLVATSEQDDTAKVTIVFDGRTATVTTDDAFKESGWCGHGVVLDGVYKR